MKINIILSKSNSNDSPSAGKDKEEYREKMRDILSKRERYSETVTKSKDDDGVTKKNK